MSVHEHDTDQPAQDFPPGSSTRDFKEPQENESGASEMVFGDSSIPRDNRVSRPPSEETSEGAGAGRGCSKDDFVHRTDDEAAWTDLAARTAEMAERLRTQPGSNLGPEYINPSVADDDRGEPKGPRGPGTMT